MTSEKIFENVLAMMKAYDAAADMSMTEKILEDPEAWSRCAFNPFIASAAALIQATREGMDKKTTPAGSLAAVKRIYKSALSMPNASLHGATRSGDRWSICDGYRFIRLNSKPESIPEVHGLGFDPEKAIPAGARDAEPVTLPTVAELKEKIAALKAEHGRAWTREPIEALPGWWCNPQYLLDMVQALPGGTAYAPAGRVSPLYYESPDGDALLLPVNHRAA